MDRSAELTARSESPTAFGRRCIPSPPHRAEKRAAGAPASGCVAPPSNIPDIATPPRKPRAAGAPVLGRHALPGVPSVAATLGAPAGRIAGLGATPDFHHGLLMRIAVVGARGQLGAAVVHECSQAHETIAFAHADLDVG